MGEAIEKTSGVTVDIADLINIRSNISGMSIMRIRHRTTRNSGTRQTRIRGRGMEYEESRAYVPGDDVRTMDWRVMARTGEAHTKVFTEEKERTVVLVVDLSSSMFFGTRYAIKSWAAAQVTAHIGWLAIQAGDRLGALVASASAHYEIRPKKTSSNLMRIFYHLSQECNIELPVVNEPSRLNFILGEVRRVTKPGTIIILMSDLLGVDEQTPGLMSALVRHNDLMTFWIHDRTEIDLWPRGRYQILTDEQQVALDLGVSSSQSWLAEQQRKHRQAIEGLTSKFNIRLCPISCNQRITPQLVQYLRKS